MLSLRTSLLAVTLASLVAAGCEDGAKKGVQARVPALEPNLAGPVQANPGPTTAAGNAKSGPQSLNSLPLWTRANQQPISLLPAIPDARAHLISQVEAKFASGEQNFKAGHLDAARRDFNDAVDWRLRPEQRSETQRTFSSRGRHGIRL